MTARDRPAVRELLRDIKQQPDEDGLRLILADWLDDHGDAEDRARAELIRLQVRGVDCPEDQLRLRDLIGAHRRAWLGPIVTWDAVAQFRRGLVRARLVVGDLASRSLLALVDREAWAWVDHVTLGSITVPSRLIAASPLLAGLNGFACAPSPFGRQVVQELSRAEWLRSVRTLDLSSQDLGFAELEPLLLSPNLESVRDLNLSNNVMSRRVIELLGRLKLRRLVLRRARVGIAEARALAHDEGFRELRELDLTDNHIAQEGQLALADSPSLAGLQSLTLFGLPLSPEGARRLRERFGGRVHLAGG